MTEKDSLSLQDFGIGLLSGLRLKGVSQLNDEDMPLINRKFVAAYNVVREGLGDEALRFYLILDQMYGTTPDVDDIIYHWLTVWATKDSPGTILRLSLPEDLARRYLNEDVIGGEELWLQAATSFMMAR